MHTDLHATGTVTIVMVMNLKRFVAREPTQSSLRNIRFVGSSVRFWPQRLTPGERFEQVRGSQAYADFLKQLRPTRWFELDQREQQIEFHGHELSTFRRYLIENYFFPTYRLTDTMLLLDQDALQATPELAAQMSDWAFKLRLTRNGLVLVKIERPIHDLPLITLSQLQLESQGLLNPATPSAALPNQWQLSMELVARFVEACNDQFVIPVPASRGRHSTIAVALTHCYSRTRLPLHDRHTIYQFSRLTGAHGPLDVCAARESYGNDIAGLLEQAMLIEEHGIRYPRYKSGQVAALFATDTASWEEELCLLTPEASFMFYPMGNATTAFMSGSMRTEQQHVYGDYWQSIARGIEHIIALKNEMQLLERDTTWLLEKIPDMTRRTADGYVSHNDRREILNLATGIAMLFKSLPHQRDALVPSSVFRASYATRKFKHLMDQLGIDEIERHIETNVQELNAFLAHFNGIQLQQDAQRTNLFFSTLTIFFSILVIPSFLADLVQIKWLDVANVSTWPGLAQVFIQGMLQASSPTLRIFQLVVLLVLLGLMIWRWWRASR